MHFIFLSYTHMSLLPKKIKKQCYPSQVFLLKLYFVLKYHTECWHKIKHSALWITKCTMCIVYHQCPCLSWNVCYWKIPFFKNSLSRVPRLLNTFSPSLLYIDVYCDVCYRIIYVCKLHSDFKVRIKWEF